MLLIVTKIIFLLLILSQNIATLWKSIVGNVVPPLNGGVWRDTM